MNNSMFPYLYDGTMGAMELSSYCNEWLTDANRGFVTPGTPGSSRDGGKLPWNVAHYHQEWRPMFMEIEVCGDRVTIHAVQFDHSIDPANPIVEIVDTLIICRCDDHECAVCNGLVLDTTMNLYTNRGDTTPIAAVAPQSVGVIERDGNWVRIHTWLGPKWINLDNQ
jgi:hypothetical protein